MGLNDISSDLGGRMRAARLALGISQRTAAERLGVSERTVQSWESGEAFPWPRHRQAVEQFLLDAEAVAP